MDSRDSNRRSSISRRRFVRDAGLAAGAGLLTPSLVRAAGRSGREFELRRRLGVPEDAREVLVFAQSSHVDPDWLLTADGYQRFTDRAFDGALTELARDPRYVYSVECTFFFRRYWESRPALRSRLRDYVNQGRIRFSGVGVTTPDTLLPEAENILRDYRVGLTWLRSQGMEVNPRLAYLPDDFGHSPTLPSLLRELGLDYAAVTRIDGGRSVMADRRPARDFPLPGSSTEELFSKLMSADFVWVGPDGAEVIAHVNPFDYSQGDLIDHAALASWNSLYLGPPARSPRQTKHKIDGYLAKLRPLSRTGYLFCPIGGDFNPPVKDLCRILDVYNRDRYPDTGAWTVLATLEDFMDLTACRRDLLPVLHFDPNPYWTGFYSSRPGLKRDCRDLSRDLYRAEALGVYAVDRGLAPYPDLSASWDISALSNHHDFITGTSRDEVFEKEQVPLVKKAREMVRDAVDQLPAPAIPPPPQPAPIQWRQTPEGRIEIENDSYLIELDPRRGGCLTRWLDRREGREVLAGPSNDVVITQDSGGMYLMGMEVYHGIYRELARASEHPAGIEAAVDQGVLKIFVTSEFKGSRFVRELYFRSDSPAVRMRLTGAARSDRTITVRFRPDLQPGRFVQNLTYGVMERPLERLYHPTFWAVKDWVDLVDRSENFGVHLGVTAPGSVSAREDGSIEAVALRNARAERSYGVVPAWQTILAQGSDPYEHTFDYAFWPHGAGGWLDRRAWEAARAALADDFIAPAAPDFPAIAATLVSLDRPDVIVTALKQAESGGGVVVRLFRYSPDPVTVRLAWSGRPVSRARRADALEREVEPLPVRDNRVEVPMPRALATVMLRFAGAD